MAFIYDQNIRLYRSLLNPHVNLERDEAGGALVWFRAKALLKTATWVHQASGDGLAALSTTPGNGNDVITHAGTGAGGMRNDQAWFVLKHPSSARQLCFQVTETDYGFGPQFSQWEIYYSFSAGFTGGSPAAGVRPTAADEQQIQVTYRPYGKEGGWCQIAADNAAPHGWWLVCRGAINDDELPAEPRSAFVFDPVVDTVPGDADPFVFMTLGDPFSEANFCYFDKGGGGEVFSDRVAVSVAYEQRKRSAANPHTSKIDLYPAIYAGGYGAYFYKGRSTMFTIPSYKFPPGHLLTVSTPGDRVMFGAMTFAWNGTVPRV